MVRLVKGGPEVPARIWRAQTLHEPGDPFNVMERSPHWAAEIDGEPVDPDRVWEARGRAIDRAEYEYQLALGRHAKQHQPQHPRADPRRRIDLLTCPMPVFRRKP